MSSDGVQLSPPPEFREFEYRILGYLVRGRIPSRKDLNPMGQFYAANRDEKEFFKYLTSHPIKTGPLPYTLKLDGISPITVTEVTTTKIASLADERRLRSSVECMLKKERSVISTGKPMRKLHNRYFEVEYRIQGYDVRGEITERTSNNPMFLWVSGVSDRNKFLKYLVSYLQRSNPTPHIVKLEGCPAMSIVSIVPN